MAQLAETDLGQAHWPNCQLELVDRARPGQVLTMSVLSLTARLLLLRLLGSAQAGVGSRQSHRAAEPEVQPGHKFQAEGNSLEAGPAHCAKNRKEWHGLHKW